MGYSGHENGIAISVAAVAMGATSLERHITLDRTMYGTDQAASLEPKGLKEMIVQINKTQTALGTDKIGHITDEEKVIAKKLRAHINEKFKNKFEISIKENISIKESLKIKSI